jgi:hypothetical protein
LELHKALAAQHVAAALALLPGAPGMAVASHEASEAAGLNVLPVQVTPPLIWAQVASSFWQQALPVVVSQLAALLRHLDALFAAFNLVPAVHV